jgi:hypothetical protein
MYAILDAEERGSLEPTGMGNKVQQWLKIL